MLIFLGFLGVFVFFGMIGGIVYAVVNKKKLSATVVKAAVSILAVVLVIGCLWWLSSKSTPPATPSAGSHFTFSGMMDLAIPFVIVITAVLVAMMFFKADWAKNISKGAWAVVVAFVAVSLLALYSDWKTGDGLFGPTTIACKPFTINESECLMTEKAMLLTSHVSMHEGEYEFCIVKPSDAEYVSNRVGINTFEVRSVRGVFPMKYKLMKNSEIHGKCPASF